MANAGTINNDLPPGFQLEGTDNTQAPTNNASAPAGFQVENSAPLQRSVAGNIIPPAIGAAAVGGAGAAAYGMARFINTPNRLVKPIDTQLQGIAKQQIGKDIDTSDLPSLLTAKYNSFKANTVAPSMDALDKNITLQKTQLKNSRSLFDQQTLNPAVDDIAQHVAGNYKPIINAAYGAYRQQQGQIENAIQQSGQALQSSDVSDFLNKTIGDSIQQGVPEDKLAGIKKLTSAFDGKEGNILDLMGNPMDISKPIPFTQIKGNVGSLLGSLPDTAKHVLAANWSDYMGKFLPPQAQNAFQDMQAKYAQFAPARNALFGLIDPAKGTFQTTALANRLRSFVKTNQDGGLTNLLGMLSNGSSITPPMQGLGDKVTNLTNLTNQRNNYASQLSALDTHRKAISDGAVQIEKTLQDGYQQHTALMQQTQNLLSQRAAVLEKYPIRTLLSNAPQTILKGLLSRHGLIAGAGALGIAGALADPESAIASVAGGDTDVAPAETPVNNTTDWAWDKNGKLYRDIVPHQGKSN